MAELDGRIATWTATLPCGELLELPAAHGVPAGRVYTAPDMPGAVRGVGPSLGEHTAEVLDELAVPDG
jgi:crotonobetainyl-CoA:carnitine CoA-transferase CaiB-like acyl-CoA transferase